MMGAKKLVAEIYKATFQFRRGSAEVWEKNNPILKRGEPGFVIDENKLKIGDGVTPWNDLKYIGNGDNANLSADGNSIILSDSIFKLAGFDAAETGAQPRKKADGTLEWVIPSSDTLGGLQTIVAGLQTDVADLQADVSAMQEVLTPSTEGAEPLPNRVEILEAKIDGIEAGAQSNKIESIRLGGNTLEITDKIVTVPIGAGLQASDEITIAENGALGIGQISVNKLVQDSDNILVLNGGSAYQ